MPKQPVDISESNPTYPDLPLEPGWHEKAYWDWRGGIPRLMWPIADLLPHPENYRGHPEPQVVVIAASLGRHGQQKPVVVKTEEPDGTRLAQPIIIAGHGVTKGLAHLKLTHVWINPYGKDGADAEEYLLDDNETQRGAEDAKEILALLLERRKERGTLDSSGWSEAAVDKLRAEVAARASRGADRAPDAEGNFAEDTDQFVTQTGTLWVLGRHRLLCDDSLKVENWQRVMGGEPPQLVVTDPPYNVDYTPGDHPRSDSEFSGIKNDHQEEGVFVQFLTDALNTAHEMLVPGAGIYICAPTGIHQGSFWDAIRATEFHLQQELTWDKLQMTLTRWDYHPDIESVFYGWKLGAEHFWFGGRDQRSCVRIKRDANAQYVHPTQKPVELFEYFLVNSCPLEGHAVDPFSGSGTLIMACQRQGRFGHGLELDPKWCDAICRRFYAETGIVPVNAETNEEFPRDRLVITTA